MGAITYETLFDPCSQRQSTRVCRAMNNRRNHRNDRFSRRRPIWRSHVPISPQWQKSRLGHSRAEWQWWGMWCQFRQYRPHRCRDVHHCLHHQWRRGASRLGRGPQCNRGCGCYYHQQVKSISPVSGYDLPEAVGVDAAVAPNEESTEHGLGQQIQDTVEDRLRVRRDDVAAFTETPCNWV